MILYKYLSSERIDVLSSLQIRYTQFGAMNDPFEFTVNLDKIAEGTKISELAKKDYKTVMEEGYDKNPFVHSIISKTDFINKVLPLEDHLMPKAVDFMNKVIELLPDTIKNKSNLEMGALSLSEKNNHQLMWSHYAEDHKGFVIGFRSDHEYFNQKISSSDELRHLRKVTYNDNRPKINLMKPVEVDIFTIKHSQWEYEAEWRIVRPFYEASSKIDGDPYPIYLFTYPASSISTVILGHRMVDANKEKIKLILESDSNYSHVELCQAFLDKKTFNIDIKSL